MQKIIKKIKSKVIVGALGIVVAFIALVIAEPCPTSISGNGITLTNPNGCDVYYVGDTIQIAWNMDTVAQVGQMIRFSNNNGKNGVTIGRVDGALPNYLHGPYLWVIPDTAYGSTGQRPQSTVSDSCQIKIFDYSIPNISDISDRLIVIKPRKQQNVNSFVNSRPLNNVRISLNNQYAEVSLNHGKSGEIFVLNYNGQVLSRAKGVGNLRCFVGNSSSSVRIIKAIDSDKNVGILSIFQK